MAPATESTGLFVHGGLNKTGTTFLQQAVFQPSLGSNYLDRSNFDVRGLQTNTIDPSKPILYSDERLLGVTVVKRKECRNEQRLTMLNNWRCLFPDSRFIVCFRQHGDFLRSLYAQYLHMGGTALFDDFFSLKETQLIRPDELNYCLIVEQIEERFPGPHFFFDYRLLVDDPGTLLQSLSEFIGFGLEQEKRSFKNNSVSPRYYKSLRFLNRVFSSKLSTSRRLPVGLFRFVTGGHTPRTYLQRRSRHQAHNSSDGSMTLRLSEIDEHYSNDWNALQASFDVHASGGELARANSPSDVPQHG